MRFEQTNRHEDVQDKDVFYMDIDIMSRAGTGVVHLEVVEKQPRSNKSSCALQFNCYGFVPSSSAQIILQYDTEMSMCRCRFLLIRTSICRQLPLNHMGVLFKA